METKPSLPPFTKETAIQKIRMDYGHLLIIGLRFDMRMNVMMILVIGSEAMVMRIGNLIRKAL